MNSTEIRAKALNLAASYFANWKASAAEHDYDAEREYYHKYDAARCMAAIIGIEEQEIEDTAWKMYGDEIRKLYDENNATI